MPSRAPPCAAPSSRSSPRGRCAACRARAPSWHRRGCSRTCTSPRSRRTCGAAGRPPRPGWCGSASVEPPPEVAAWFGLGARPAGLVGRAGAPGRRGADGLRGRLVLPDPAARPRPARPGRLALRALRAGVRPARRHRRADGARRAGRRHARAPPRRRPRRPVLAFDRLSRTGGAPLEHVVSHYRGDRYELHISLDSTMPEEAGTPTQRGPHDHRGRHRRGGRQAAHQPRARSRSSVAA